MRGLFVVLLLVALLVWPAPVLSGSEDVPSSPSYLAASGDLLLVADATRKMVFTYDPATGETEPLRDLGAGDQPTGLAASPDGTLLYLTTQGAPGRILGCGVVGARVAVIATTAAYPTAPVPSPDGKTLWVCHRYANRVVAYDVSTGEVRARITVGREPIAAGITPDGKRLVVGQHLPGGAADADYAATAVHVIDTAKATLLESIALPNGSTSLMDVSVSPDGRYAFATHVLARYSVPTSQIERGWINTNALSIVDLERHELHATVLLDDVGRGAANPWGVTCSPDGALLFVAHSGTHELSRIDLPALLEALEKMDAKTRADLAYDLAFLAPHRRRLPLKGEGPRDVVVAGGTIWAAEYFSGSLGSFPLDGDDCTHATSVPLQDEMPKPSLERRGEALFYDARLCLQEWQSCASCHPGARVDGLNWDLLNDGIGNPKNTKSMLLAHRTPPAMSLSKRATAEAAVRAGIRHILFASRPEAEAQAIDAYLKALTPQPSADHLVAERRTAAARGAIVYAKAGCATCHAGPLHTDGKAYDLGLGKGREANQPFDTPTLVETWRTAPYLHDGRAPDLLSVLQEHNPDDKHGKTSGLSEKELDDLVAYLRSL